MLRRQQLKSDWKAEQLRNKIRKKRDRILSESTSLTQKVSFFLSIIQIVTQEILSAECTNLIFHIKQNCTEVGKPAVTQER